MPTRQEIEDLFGSLRDHLWAGPTDPSAAELEELETRLNVIEALGPLSTDEEVVEALADALSNVVTNSNPALTNARTPTAHKTSHEDGGSDELTLAQSQISGLVDALAALTAALPPSPRITLVGYDDVRYTAGNLNLRTATMAWKNLGPAGLDLSAPAQIGDRARVSIDALVDDSGVDAFIDMVTVFSNAPATSFAGRAEAAVGPPYYGVPTWRCQGGTYQKPVGFVDLVLGAGDVQDGTVTVRPRCCTAGDADRTLFSGANYAYFATLEIFR